MAGRYDIALGKGPEKTVTLSFKASSGEEAEAILKDLSRNLDLKFLFTQPYPVTDTNIGSVNAVKLSIAPEDPAQPPVSGISMTADKTDDIEDYFIPKKGKRTRNYKAELQYKDPNVA